MWNYNVKESVMALRKIIEIDEEKCDGCGQCVIACAEGALEIIDGKARVVGDILCDGLGACIGECPQGALKIIEREGEAFDEKAVEKRLASLADQEKTNEPTLACGCPSSSSQILSAAPCASASGPAQSTLGHWPVKLQLLGPNAPFLKGADLVLLADCAATAYPELHQKVLPEKVVAMGCPKLDDLNAHIDRLAQILKEARPQSLTVVFMEVPCCKGFIYGAQKAMEKAGVDLPAKVMQIANTGKVLMEGQLKDQAGQS